MMAPAQYVQLTARRVPLLIKNRGALFLITAGLGTSWLLILICFPVTFWGSHDDYVYLSLAHALNLESSLHDGVRYADGGLSGHPGVPLYLVSWLCLQATALFTRRADIIPAVLANPDGFFLATRIAALLIALAAVAALWRLFADLPILPRSAAILSPFAADPWCFHYGLTVLGNETFALPVYTLLFFVVRQMAKRSSSQVGPLLRAGIVSSLGYTIKLLYLDVLVGAGFATIAASALSTARWVDVRWLASATLRCSVMLAAFVVAAVAILLTVAGWNSTLGLLQFHWSIIIHSKVYGEGQADVMSPAAMAQAIGKIWQHSPLILEMSAALLLTAIAIRRRHQSGRLERIGIVWLSAAISMLLFATVSVLKHYQAHYVIAVAALLPFLWAFVLSEPRLRPVSGIVLLVGLPLSVAGAWQHFAKQTAAAQAAQADAREIMALPLGPHEARLWTYRVANQHFVRAFVLSYAGVPTLSRSLETSGLSDYSSLSRVVRPYRYVVLDRSYFPDEAVFRAAAKGKFWPTQGLGVHICPGDQVRQLRQTLVIELKGGC